MSSTGASWGCQGLSVRHGATVALEDVSFEARAGTVAAVVGGDGAGKTSLLRALAGTVRPSAGTVRRPGERRLGYVSAGPGVWSDLTVDENLDFAGRAYGLSADELDRRVAWLLDRTGLAEARGRLAGRLSGGMRQKLALAMAVAHEPDLLILDEPTTGLDPKGMAEMRTFIRDLGSGRRTVLLSSHLMQEVEQVCDRVGVIHRGALVREGTVDELRGGRSLVVRAEPVEGAVRVLQDLPEVAAVTTEDGELTVTADPAAAAAINRALVGAGIAVSELRSERASLEEVFLSEYATPTERNPPPATIICASAASRSHRAASATIPPASGLFQ